MRYKITDEILKLGDLILHRIEATENFNAGDYLVIPGDKGGWIEKESNLQENAWVDDEGMVMLSLRAMLGYLIAPLFVTMPRSMAMLLSGVIPKLWIMPAMPRFLVMLS